LACGQIHSACGRYIYICNRSSRDHISNTYMKVSHHHWVACGVLYSLTAPPNVTGSYLIGNLRLRQQRRTSAVGRVLGVALGCRRTVWANVPINTRWQVVGGVSPTYKRRCGVKFPIFFLLWRKIPYILPPPFPAPCCRAGWSAHSPCPVLVAAVGGRGGLYCP
jgi:hypothetical protein